MVETDKKKTAGNIPMIEMIQCCTNRTQSEETTDLPIDLLVVRQGFSIEKSLRL